MNSGSYSHEREDGGNTRRNSNKGVSTKDKGLLNFDENNFKENDKHEWNSSRQKTTSHKKHWKCCVSLWEDSRTL